MLAKDSIKTICLFLILFFVLSGLVVTSQAQTSTIPCDQCGMALDLVGQSRYKIVDSSGQQLVACCPICALRLQRTYGDLNITSFCDYNGPSYPIAINSRDNGTAVTVNPPTALIIAAGSCTKNRLVYDSLAADNLLLSPNNGTSPWLSTLSNSTVASNATRMSVVQAALINGAGLPSPSPSPSPTATIAPTVTYSPTVTPSVTTYNTPKSSPFPSPTNRPSITSSASAGITQECEICGMDVPSESQLRYKATDGNGNTHYVECFMCALALVNHYESMNIETYCDWYGPNYPITIVTSNYGQEVKSTPTDAIFLRGGSCVTARAAYNQTAEDNLIQEGFSQYTSPNQLYKLPSNTEVKSVSEAIKSWYSRVNINDSAFPWLLVIVLAIGVVITIVTLLAYVRVRNSSKGNNLL